jgi:secreted protein with Ig-like and vWFA domain
MLSYVVIHRSADKKLHDNKLNMQNVTVNTVFASEETGSMSDLLSINNVKSEHSLLGEVFESGLTRLAKATTPKHHFDSALGKKLPLYTVTCIE